tara:strand:- start:580 stop:1149 length:570 start_codon:yes stop_codon:yes gene_type:complete
MAVSKRVRFEVFKRDAFACQYCGRTPPTVVLECDHIHAVANGGSDDETNLVTSCFDCNRGKSDVPLDAATPSVAARMDRQREVAEQADAFNRFVMERRQHEDNLIDHIGETWFNHIKKRKNQYVFGPARVPSIRRFLRQLSIAEILEAVEIAHQRKPIHDITPGRDEQTFKYFCGICWSMIRNREGGDE